MENDNIFDIARFEITPDFEICDIIAGDNTNGFTVNVNGREVPMSSVFAIGGQDIVPGEQARIGYVSKERTIPFLFGGQDYNLAQLTESPDDAGGKPGANSYIAIDWPVNFRGHFTSDYCNLISDTPPDNRYGIDNSWNVFIGSALGCFGMSNNIRYIYGFDYAERYVFGKSWGDLLGYQIDGITGAIVHQFVMQSPLSGVDPSGGNGTRLTMHNGAILTDLSEDDYKAIARNYEILTKPSVVIDSPFFVTDVATLKTNFQSEQFLIAFSGTIGTQDSHVTGSPNNYQIGQHVAKGYGSAWVSLRMPDISTEVWYREFPGKTYTGHFPVYTTNVVGGLEIVSRSTLDPFVFPIEPISFYKDHIMMVMEPVGAGFGRFIAQGWKIGDTTGVNGRSNTPNPSWEYIEEYEPYHLGLGDQSSGGDLASPQYVLQPVPTAGISSGVIDVGPTFLDVGIQTIYVTTISQNSFKFIADSPSPSGHFVTNNITTKVTLIGIYIETGAIAFRTVLDSYTYDPTDGKTHTISQLTLATGDSNGTLGCIGSTVGKLPSIMMADVMTGGEGPNTNHVFRKYIGIDSSGAIIWKSDYNKFGYAQDFIGPQFADDTYFYSDLGMLYSNSSITPAAILLINQRDGIQQVINPQAGGGTAGTPAHPNQYGLAVVGKDYFYVVCTDPNAIAPLNTTVFAKISKETLTCVGYHQITLQAGAPGSAKDFASLFDDYIYYFGGNVNNGFGPLTYYRTPQHI